MVEMMVSVLTWLGLACWVLCLWWMHRNSSRHDALLSEPPQMTRTIEPFSRAEKDIVQEVHPKVSQGKGKVEKVAPVVRTDSKP